MKMWFGSKPSLRRTGFVALSFASIAFALVQAQEQPPPAQYYNPDWSPDGRTLLFESTRDGKFAIYQIRADGTDLRRLTTGAANDEQPRWSRNGSQIVFISDRDGHLQLYVMLRDGTAQRRLTSSKSIDYDPAFSPNGKHVVFISRPDRAGANHSIAVVRSDGTGRRSLTDGGGNDMSPQWSPNGKWIVFERAPLATKPYRELTEGERAALRRGREIYVIRPDGTGLR